MKKSQLSNLDVTKLSDTLGLTPEEEQEIMERMRNEYPTMHRLFEKRYFTGQVPRIKPLLVTFIGPLPDKVWSYLGVDGEGTVLVAGTFTSDPTHPIEVDHGAHYTPTEEDCARILEYANQRSGKQHARCWVHDFSKTLGFVEFSFQRTVEEISEAPHCIIQLGETP